MLKDRRRPKHEKVKGEVLMVDVKSYISWFLEYDFRNFYLCVRCKSVASFYLNPSRIQWSDS